jgi:hypothetical protein
MYALTIWQPWADAIAFGDKDVENRSWPAPPWIIGVRICIHAGREIDPAAVPPRGRSWPAPQLPGGQRVRGAVIATAVVAGCHHERQCGGSLCSPWAAARQWHWELSDRHALAVPVKARGFQRLWRLPPGVSRAALALNSDGRIGELPGSRDIAYVGGMADPTVAG